MRNQQHFLPDEFFTNEKEAKRLISEFKHREGFSKFDLIVEPSAGNGSFYNNLPKKEGRRIIGIDLTPRTSGVIKHDFLTWKYPTKNDPQRTLCIGNPPFGRNSKLASKFVNRCALFANHIVMILPVTFKQIPHGFQEQWAIRLSPAIFINPDGSQVEQALFTKFVYYKFTDKKSLIKKKITSNGMWERLSVDDRYDADFRIVRVGDAGTVYSVKDEYFEPSKIWHSNHFYIKVHKKYKHKINKIIEMLSKHRWSFTNTVAFHSLNFQTLAKYLNKILPVI